MRFLPTSLPGVIIVEPDVYQDDRGFFLDTYHLRKYRDAGIPLAFVQENHSRSAYGTVRGLHAEQQHPQRKLIRAIGGEIFEVFSLSSRRYGIDNTLQLEGTNRFFSRIVDVENPMHAHEFEEGTDLL
jgi:dTDP-4-dehydrorhamnose 3,5-epimerase